MTAKLVHQMSTVRLRETDSNFFGILVVVMSKSKSSYNGATIRITIPSVMIDFKCSLKPF